MNPGGLLGQRSATCGFVPRLAFLYQTETIQRTVRAIRSYSENTRGNSAFSEEDRRDHVEEQTSNTTGMEQLEALVNRPSPRRIAKPRAAGRVSHNERRRDRASVRSFANPGNVDGEQGGSLRLLGRAAGDRRVRRDRMDAQTSSHPQSPDVEPREEPVLTPKRTSTITDAELDAFSALFGDLLKDKRSSAEKQSRLPKTQPKRDPMRETSNHNELDAIMASVTGAEAPVAPMDKIEEYPQSLQDLATQTFLKVAQQTPSAENIRDEARFNQDPLVKKRVDELSRVTTRLIGSRTDAELWNVLEEELFSKIRALDLDGQFKHEFRKNDLNEPRSSQGKSNAAVDSLKPDLSTLAPNYPLHLLTALRILTRRTKPASPLALQLIPMVRSLGQSSNILGCSTSLYNELLWHQWNRLHSLPLVMDTVNAMEEDGIEPDGKTFEIIDGITHWRHWACRGDFGDVVAQLESMDWRIRADKKLRAFRDRGLKEHRRAIANDRAEQRRQWQITEHPGSFGRSDIAPGPTSPVATETKVRRMSQRY